MRTLLDQLISIYTAPTFYERKRRLKKADSPAMRYLLFFAFSPTVTAYRYEFSYNHTNESKVRDNTVSEFMKVTTDMRNCTIKSRTEFAEAMAEYVESFPASYRWLIYEILRRDVKIRLTAHQIEQQMPGTLHVFGMRMPKTFSPSKIKFPVWVLPQPVGVKANIYVDRGFASVINRRGDALLSMQHLNDLFRKFPDGKYEVEIVHPDGNDVQFIRVARDVPGAEKAVAIVRDWEPLADAANPKMLPPERYRRLALIQERFAHPSWTILEPHLCRNSTELNAMYRYFVEEQGYPHIQLITNTPFGGDKGMPSIIVI